MPSTTIRYPAGVFGYAAGSPAAGGSVTEPFIAVAAIAEGAGVELDFTNGVQVKTATTGAVTQRWVGIAMEAAAAGESCMVTLIGHAYARCSTAITAGDNLDRSAATAGEMATVAAAFGTVKAVALETVGAAANSRVKVLVVRM